MPPTTIRTPPSLQDFVPLDEFQSSTPDTFIGGKPILHYHLSNAKASIPKSQTGTLAVFPNDSAAKESGETNGETEAVVEKEVDIFASSENLTIFSKDVEAGVSIPYPSISIHAVKQVGPEGGDRQQAVWMQLEFSDGYNDEDDSSCVELTIIPSASASSTDESPSAASKLYEAIANCSNLHPDPEQEEEAEDHDRIIFEGSAEHEALEGFTGVLRGAADGSLPPPLPGSGGWITADNVHEYFDADGNWIGGEDQEELGDGAGRTRGRDEVDGQDANGGGDDGPDDNKRPRVD